MPRYFFDIHDGVELRDEIGRDLESGAILRAEALQAATRLVAAEAEDSKETTLILTVRDAAGAMSLKVRVVCQVEEFWPLRAVYP